MRKIVLAALAIMIAVTVNAAPAYPGLITVTQQDGSVISYYLHGDEHFSYMTSADGYLLATNEAGIIEYGDFSNGKTVVPTGVPAHNESSRDIEEQIYVRGLQKAEAISPTLNVAVQQMRMQAETASRPVYRFPRKGSPKSIIILVGFKDRAFTKSNQDFVDMANQTNYSANGGTGSIKDYFTEASFGQFSPQFDVYGPYTLDRNMEYYGKQVGSQHDENAEDLIKDACNAAYNAKVDFAKYDTDSDGFVDNVFVVYAGYNQAEGGGDNTIWPHRSRINYKIGNKTIIDYACTSEFSGAKGSNRMCGIGTFCHEFSHVMGLPDFYDTDYSKGYSAMGSWDIMTSGGYNNGGKTPPTYTAYERFLIGWLKPTPLTEADTVDCEGSYELHSLISSNEAYIISKKKHNLSGSGPDPLEFFMLEYRKKEGRDTYSGLGEGMLITHIKYNQSRWGSNKPNNDKNDLGYEPILPTKYSVNGSSADCFPGTSGVNYCQFTLRGETEPLKREVINIEDKGTHCEFDYLKNITNLQLKVKDIETYYTNKAPTEVEFEVDGWDIAETVELTFKTNTGFKMRKKGDEQYQTRLTLTPAADSTIKATIEVQYTPSRITYDTYEYNKFIAKGSSGKLNKMVDFRFRNRRPVYITTPEANEPEEVSGTSFTANWSYVNDTTEGAIKPSKYYLDLYNISNEPSTEYESFENFPNMDEGWETTFSTTERVYKTDGNISVLFSSSSDTLWTKEYMSDITNISFWVEPITTVGVLKIAIQDYASGMWGNLEQMVFNSSTKGGTHSVSVPAGYRRVRISYEQTSGQLAFDYLGITTASTTTFICNNTLVTDTFYKATGLKANTEYIYVVRATDKDEKGRYENVSDYSNVIVAVTKGGSDVPKNEDGSTNIKLGVSSDGTRYIVSVSEVRDGYSLFIYSMDGKMVKKLPVNDVEVEIPELMDGMYILKYTKDGKNNRKDGVTKMYYHLK